MVPENDIIIICWSKPKKIQSMACWMLHNIRLFGDMSFLTRWSCIEIWSGDVVGRQGKIQGVQSSRPRAEAEVAGLWVKGVVGHVQQATPFHSHLLRQCHLQRHYKGHKPKSICYVIPISSSDRAYELKKDWLKSWITFPVWATLVSRTPWASSSSFEMYLKPYWKISGVQI